MVEMVFKGISCESYEHRSQREIQLVLFLTFPFFSTAKEATRCVQRAQAPYIKAPRSRSRTPNLVQLGEWPF